MANNLGITPGAGALIGTDQDSGDSSHVQRTKLAVSSAGVSTSIPASVANGLTVDVTRVAGVAQLPAALVGSRLDVNIGACGATVPVSGTVAVTQTQLPAALVGNRLDVNIGASGVTVPVSSAQLPGALVGGNLTVVVGAALPAGANIVGLVKLVDTGGVNVCIVSAAGAVKVDGSAVTQPVSGTVTVNGTITANQGTPAVVANAWPMKVSDGTNFAGLTNVGGAQCIKVDVVQTVGQGAATDKTAFVEGANKCDVVAGVVNDAIGSDPAEDQSAALRITVKRGLHVNIRKVDGTELGIAATPFRVDPTGTTTQPVSEATNLPAINTATTSLALAVATPAAAIPTRGVLVCGSQAGTTRAIATSATGAVLVDGTATTQPVSGTVAATVAQLPAALVGARLDVNIGASGITVPVSGTVSVNQGTANATPWNENLAQVNGHTVIEAAAGIQKVGIADAAGAAFSDANPQKFTAVPSPNTIWMAAVSYTASLSDQTIRTPTGGKRFVLCGLIITPNVTAGSSIKIYDNTNAAAGMIYQGLPGLGTIVIQFAMPLPSAAINNVLRWASGASATGDIVAWGYEL